MNITDELREYVQVWRETPNLMDDLDAGDIDGLLGDFEHIADHIDAEHERQLEVLYRDMSDAEYIKLPVDADGVPIHVGDVMDGTCPSGKHVNGTVNAIGDGVFWLSNVQFSLKPNYMHHHHEPTVEDVLEEYRVRYYDLVIDMECKNITNDEYVQGIKSLNTEYAKKLRLIDSEE
jgi:hypothetical protein